MQFRSDNLSEQLVIDFYDFEVSKLGYKYVILFIYRYTNYIQDYYIANRIAETFIIIFKDLFVRFEI